MKNPAYENETYWIREAIKFNGCDIFFRADADQSMRRYGITRPEVFNGLRDGIVLHTEKGEIKWEWRIGCMTCDDQCFEICAIVESNTYHIEIVDVALT